MDDLTTKSRYFITILISLSLGFFISFVFTGTSSTETYPQLNQVNEHFHLLEQQISDINDSLDILLEKNNRDNLTVKLDSPDAENMTSENFKNILKEIIHEELNTSPQEDIADNEDTTKAWELISQAQGTEVTPEFFQSKEINALPAKQKEMVISEIIGMMNRGEIDADKFFNVK